MDSEDAGIIRGRCLAEVVMPIRVRMLGQLTAVFQVVELSD